MSNDGTPAKVGSDGRLGVESERTGQEGLRREFDEWAHARDFDLTRSSANHMRYASERTQGAWQAWAHGIANWRLQRDSAVRLLHSCEAGLAHFKEWPLAVELRATVRRSLGMDDA